MDGEYIVYVSVEGFLYAAPFDEENLSLGRPTVVLRGLRREGTMGAGQYAISPSGTLLYAPGGNVAAGHLVRTNGTSPVEVLPIPRSAIRNFDLSPDGRKMVVVVQEVDAQELWVFDLESRQSQQLLRAFVVAEPRWDPGGTRLVFQARGTIEDSPVVVTGPAALPLRLDTVRGVSGYLSHYAADTLLLWGGGEGLVAANLAREPVAVDTFDVPGGAQRPALSPTGAWLAYLADQDVVVESFPPPGRRFRVAQAGGSDPLWLSDTELVYRSSTTWMKVEVGADGPQVPIEWFEDPNFIDTWQRSQVQSPGGEIVYLRGDGINSATYLRVIPDWVRGMKAAVDAANR